MTTTITAPKPKKITSKLKRDTPTQASVAKPSIFRRVRTGFPVAVWTVVIRLLIVVLDYLLLMATTLMVVPRIAAFLYQFIGGPDNGMGIEGLLAFWILPAGFLTLAVLFGEIVLMRTMWHLGTRGINALRDRAGRTTTK